MSAASITHLLKVIGLGSMAHSIVVIAVAGAAIALTVEYVIRNIYSSSH